MAVALFRNKIDNLPEMNGWRVESAGTWGMDGSDMAEGVKTILKEKGIEIQQHCARTVDEELLNSFNLILTMEKGQKEALRIEFPVISERVYQLSEMIGERFDIRDPIGEPLDEFRKTARTLTSVLDKGFDRILQLAGAEK